MPLSGRSSRLTALAMRSPARSSLHLALVFGGASYAFGCQSLVGIDGNFTEGPSDTNRGGSAGVAGSPAVDGAAGNVSAAAGTSGAGGAAGAAGAASGGAAGGGGATKYPPCGPGGLDALRDDFSDATTSDGLWTYGQQGSASSEVAGGALTMRAAAIANSPSRNFTFRRSITTYTLANCYALIHLSSVAFNGNPGFYWDIDIHAQPEPSTGVDRVAISIEGDQAVHVSSVTQDVESYLASALLPATSVWLRMLESGGTLSFGLATDGLTWGEPLATMPTPAWASSVQVGLWFEVTADQKDIVNPPHVAIESFNAPP
jgi:hypothetical protein